MTTRPRQSSFQTAQKHLNKYLDLFVIFGIALFIRLIHYTLVRENFWFKTLLLDDRIYDAWAQEIAKGDWALLSKGPFRFNPGYPYFLALLYFLTGRSVVVIQYQLGAFSCALLAWLGKKCFSVPVGRLAGMMLALYGPAIFYEERLLTPAIMIFSNIALLCFIVYGLEHRKPLPWGLAGLSCGFSWLLNPAIALFVLFLWIWLFSSEKKPSRPLIFGAFFLGGVLLVTGPILIRNAVLENKLTLSTTTVVGGMQFYIGNNPESNGVDAIPKFARNSPQMHEDFVREAQKRLGRSLTLSQASSYWLYESLRWMCSHPIDYLKLLKSKLNFVIGDAELLDNFPRDQYPNFAKLGFIPLLSWGLVFPFGIVGLILAIKKGKDELIPLYIYFGASLMIPLIFFAYSRYRFPALPSLILFSSYGCVEIFNHMRNGKTKNWVPAVVLTSVLFFICNRGSSYTGDSWHNHVTNGMIYESAGKLEDAKREYLKAVELSSGQTEPVKDLVQACVKTKDYPTAIKSLERLQESGFDDPWILAMKGHIFFQTNDFSNAIRSFQKLTKVQPRDAEAYLALGLCQWQAHRTPEAIDSLSKAIELEPQNSNYRDILRKIKAGPSPKNP